VQVTFDEARQHRRAIGIMHDGVRAFEVVDILGTAHGNDLAIGNRYGLGSRLRRVESNEAAIGDDPFCVAGHAGDPIRS
jgi:hypothetical protein